MLSSYSHVGNPNYVKIKWFRPHRYKKPMWRFGPDEQGTKATGDQGLDPINLAWRGVVTKWDENTFFTKLIWLGSCIRALAWSLVTVSKRSGLAWSSDAWSKDKNWLFCLLEGDAANSFGIKMGIVQIVGTCPLRWSWWVSKIHGDTRCQQNIFSVLVDEVQRSLFCGWAPLWHDRRQWNLVEVSSPFKACWLAMSSLCHSARQSSVTKSQCQRTLSRSEGAAWLCTINFIGLWEETSRLWVDNGMEFRSELVKKSTLFRCQRKRPTKDLQHAREHKLIRAKVILH